MGRITTFIALSGGVDSTHCLWRWLRDNPRSTGKEILVHHVLLHQRRRDVEKEACTKILKYLNSKKMTNYRYVETSFCRGTLGGKLYDLHIIGIMSGYVLSVRPYKDLRTILGCYCKEESPRTVALIAKGMTMRQASEQVKGSRQLQFINNIEFISGKKYDYQAPYIAMKKKEMIDELPQELRQAVWFCRNPKDGKPCTKCFNCRRVLPSLKSYI